MRRGVTLQITLLGKSFVTNGAAERFLAGWLHHHQRCRGSGCIGGGGGSGASFAESHRNRLKLNVLRPADMLRHGLSRVLQQLIVLLLLLN